MKVLLIVRSPIISYTTKKGKKNPIMLSFFFLSYIVLILQLLKFFSDTEKIIIYELYA